VFQPANRTNVTINIRKVGALRVGPDLAVQPVPPPGIGQVEFTVQVPNFGTGGGIGVTAGSGIFTSGLGNPGAVKITAGAIVVDGPLAPAINVAAPAAPGLGFEDTGGAIAVDAGPVTVGGSGDGVLGVEGSGCDLTLGSLMIGDQAGSNGQVKLSRAQTTVGGTVTVGNEGTGYLNVWHNPATALTPVGVAPVVPSLLNCGALDVGLGPGGDGAVDIYEVGVHVQGSLVAGAGRSSATNITVSGTGPVSLAGSMYNGSPGQLLVGGSCDLGQGPGSTTSVTISGNPAGLLTYGPAMVGSGAGSRAGMKR
jgi:hypothetical protein